MAEMMNRIGAKFSRELGIGQMDKLGKTSSRGSPRVLARARYK
jgi:hypothetical protein